MRSIVIFQLSLIMAIAAQAGAPNFLSFEDGFKKFTQESKSLDFESQLKSWESNVESIAPEIYLNLFSNGDSSKLDASRRAEAQKSFPAFFENQISILKQFQIFNTVGKKLITSLVLKFPDVDFSKVEVIALPAFNHFNGLVKIFNGHIYVLFGMDEIAAVLKNPEVIPGAYLVNDLPVLMAHEFTHALHYLMSDFGQDDETTAAFFGPLWDEGLSEVHSQMLVPGADLSSVFMEKNLLNKCTSDVVAQWAGEYLKDSIGDEATLTKAFAKWFTSGGLQEHGVFRGGYCLGYNVVMDALRTHSINDLLKMNRADAYALSRRTLEEFQYEDNKSLW